MFDGKDRSSVANRTILAWIIGSMSSFAYSLETEEPITVNNARTPQPWLRFSADNVRCFCNLPQCVSTGYMCKSSGGACFSDVSDHVGYHSKDYRGRHGCVELLSDKDSRALCEIRHDLDPKLHKKKSLVCCYHDMCNHVDSPVTKDLIHNTLLGEAVDNIHQNDIGRLQQPIDYTNSQVWFRAATIAVPVCGAVILFILIAVAVKILRNENQNSTRHKLGKYACDKVDNVLRKPQPKCLYHQCQTDELQKIQVPLLIQNEIVTHQSGNKNENNAKLNLMQDRTVTRSTAVVLDIERIVPKNYVINQVNNDNCIDIKFVNDDKLFKSISN